MDKTIGMTIFIITQDPQRMPLTAIVYAPVSSGNSGPAVDKSKHGTAATLAAK